MLMRSGHFKADNQLDIAKKNSILEERESMYNFSCIRELSACANIMSRNYQSLAGFYLIIYFSFSNAATCRFHLQTFRRNTN